MGFKAGLRAGIAAALVGLLAASGPGVWGPARAHDQHEHAPAPGGDAGAAEPPDPGGQSDPEAGGSEVEPFPADIGGEFALIDQFGKPVTDADFRGRYMLIFFGYALCDSICTVGMKRMAEAIDLLGERGEQVQPILITVDPENDTPEALAAHMPTVHPRFLGLTGPPDAIAAAMKSYKVNAKRVGESWKGTPVISHGSYIYLMGPDGELLTILPPVFSSEAMAAIIGRYLG